MRPMKGFVAQGMDGRKGTLPRAPVGQMLDVFAAGSGTFTAAYSGILSIYIFGGGGGGASGAANGGGGGAAAFKRIRIAQGQAVPYTVGAGGAIDNPGGASSVTLPNSQTITAGGGSAGNAGGAGGAPSGQYDDGGAGGAGGTAGGTGSTGANSGNAGSNGAGGGGGGGAGGVGTTTSGMGYPFPSAVSTGGAVGTGGIGNNTVAGVSGRVLMILQRYAAKP